MKSLLKSNKHFLLLTIIFSIFGTGAAFALPYTPSDAQLNPTCAPGDAGCYVNTLAIGSTVSSGTTGSLLFAGASGALSQDNANLFWDDTNDRLGIGTITPTNMLDVTYNQGSFPERMFFGGSGRLNIIRYNASQAFRVQRANGTIAAPTQILNGQQIGEFGFEGYNSGSAAFSRTFNMYATATEDYTSSGAIGSTLTFLKVKTGSNSGRSFMYVDGNNRTAITSRDVTLTGTLPSTLYVQGDGSTSSTYTAQFQNATGTSNSLVIRDDGFVGVGANAPSASELFRVEGSGRFNFNTNGGLVLSQGFSNATGSILQVSSPYVGATSGTVPLVRIQGGGTDLGSLTSETATYFHVEYGRNGGLAQPTFTGEANLARLTTASGSSLGNSSTGTYNALKIDPAVNQSGSGRIRALYINPTLTAAADFRAIETTAGKIVFAGLAGFGASDDYVCISSANVLTRGASCGTSSQRFKHDIQDYPDALSKVLQLRPVSFTYNENNKKEIGFVAEEVNTIEPRLVIYEDDGVTPKSLKYPQFTTLLVGAIKEMQANLTSLDTTKENTLGSLIRKFLEDAGNGLGRVFVGEVKTNKIDTDQLCFRNGICITGDQVQQLLQNANTPSSTPDDSQTQDLPEEPSVPDSLDAPDIVPPSGDSV